MATTIVTKYGGDAPAASDIVRGELAVDTENGRLYTENSSGAVVELGLNPEGNVNITGTVTASSTLTAQKLVSTNGVLELDDNGSHNGIINSPASLFINIDSDNGSTGEDFVIGKDRTSTSGGTELFRVQEDGNVGIGVSPNYPIHVEKSVDGDWLGKFKNTHATNGYGLLIHAGDDASVTALSVGNYAGAGDYLVVKGDGNVGIGTSSPAIGGGRTYDVALTIDGGVSGGAEDTGALEVGGSTSVNDRLVGSISYFNRDNSGAGATTRRQVAIIEARSVTSDSNAGDDSGANLTFSTKSEGGSVAERMRIDASGNLLVSKTASDGSVAGHELRAGSFAIHTRDNGPALYARRIGSGTNDDGPIQVFENADGQVGSIGAHSSSLQIGTSNTQIRFADAEDSFYVVNSAGVARDNSHDLGKNGARFKDLHLSGVSYNGDGSATAPSISFGADDNTGFYRVGSDQIGFVTAGTIKAKLDASGNLLVGGTSASAKLIVDAGLSSGETIRADNSKANYAGVNIYSVLLGSGTNNATAVHFQGYAEGATRFQVQGNGAVYGNGTYGTYSDLKLKENIVDANSQWADIKAVQLKNYSMKKDTLSEANQLGVIAQDLEASGMQKLIEEIDDKDVEGNLLGTTTKHVKYSVLHLKALGALQEAMERIESLEARIAALES